MSFSAASTERMRISVRPRSPKRHSSLSVVSSNRAAAMCTRPTGLSRVPPPGPATPVHETAICAVECLSAPSAIARATSSETAPWRTIVVSLTPRSFAFERLLYTMKPHSTTSEAPGISVSEAAINPPVQDSAVATVSFFKRASSISALARIRMRSENISHQSDVQHAVKNARGDQSGENVVGHHAPSSRQTLRRRQRPGLQHVEQPEEKKAHHIGPPIMAPKIKRDREEGDPLAGDLVEHAFGRIENAHAFGMRAAGPDADDGGDRRRNRDRLPAQQHQRKSERQRESGSECPRRNRDPSDAKARRQARGPGRHDGSLTVATACAAMPSLRPVKPKPSLVVALTLT